MPYRSTVAKVAHACGHDVHTTVLLGLGLALAQLDEQGELPGRVRLIFQPAEEYVPSGAPEVIASGALKDVVAIFALHCYPQLPAGLVGVRSGPFTAAADTVEVRLTGPGGHTARPHLTADLVHALGRVIVDVPALLDRRVDPRAGVSMVWGAVQRRRGVQRDPRRGPRPRHGPDPQPRRLARGPGADHQADPRRGRAHRRRGRGAIQPRRAAGDQRPDGRRGDRRARPARRSAPTGWSRPRSAWAARTSPSTWTTSRAR